MAGYRKLAQKAVPETEDTMMAQSGIKPAPEMKQMAKDMAKRDMPMKKMVVKPKK